MVIKCIVCLRAWVYQQNMPFTAQIHVIYGQFPNPEAGKLPYKSWGIYHMMPRLKKKKVGLAKVSGNCCNYIHTKKNYTKHFHYLPNTGWVHMVLSQIELLCYVSGTGKMRLELMPPQHETNGPWCWKRCNSRLSQGQGEGRSQVPTRCQGFGMWINKI